MEALTEAVRNGRDPMFADRAPDRRIRQCLAGDTGEDEAGFVESLFGFLQARSFAHFGPSRRPSSTASDGSQNRDQ